MGKQTKYTKSARGKECQVRLWNVCNHNPETTVLAHLNGGGGGMKHLDIHAAYACSDCHSYLDGGYVNFISRDDRDHIHLQAVINTQKIMVEDGILKL